MRSIMMLAVLALVVGGQGANQAEVQLQAAIKAEVFDGNLKVAIERYQEIIATFRSDRPVVAKALVRMGQCYERLGEAQGSEARKAYERVVREFADQKDAAEQARALLAAQDHDRPPATGVTDRQVWVLPDDPNPPGRPSPDGRFIPYTDMVGQRLNLHDLVTGENRVIVEPEAGLFVGSPSVSPDGKQIAYTRYGRHVFWGTDYELRVAHIDGSGAKVVVGKQQTAFSVLAWSPTGRDILIRVSKSPGGPSLAMVSALDGAMRELTAGGEESNGCFSADGKFIVTYPVRGSGATGGTGPLTLRPVDGGPATLLFESPARNLDPVWTPDGRHLVFRSDRSGASDLWSMPMRDGRPTGKPQRIRSNVELMHPLGFTRDGTLYYRLASPYMQDVHVADFAPATGLAVSNATRVNERFVGTSGRGIAWSPDGRFLAYSREPGGTIAAVVIRSDRTGEEREIVPVALVQQKLAILDLDWMPDGQSLIAEVRASTGGHTLLQQIDTRTGETRLLIDLAATRERTRDPALSRDGRTLFYIQLADESRNADRTRRLMSRDLVTGSTKELYRSTGTLEGMSMSPDGRELLFQGSYQNLKTSSLLVMPVEGGSVREVYRSREWMSADVWSADGRRILFAPMGNTGPQLLMSVPVDGGEPQPTGLSLPAMYRLAVRPDGRRIAVVSGETGPDELWVVRNLLPASKAPGK